MSSAPSSARSTGTPQPTAPDRSQPAGQGRPSGHAAGDRRIAFVVRGALGRVPHRVPQPRSHGTVVAVLVRRAVPFEPCVERVSHLAVLRQHHVRVDVERGADLRIDVTVSRKSPVGGFSAFLQANDLPLPEPGTINAVVDPGGVGPRVLFQRVPETKTLKNRVHLDVRAGDRHEEKVTQFEAAGGTVLERVTQQGRSWVVMADPEGNEVCMTGTSPYD